MLRADESRVIDLNPRFVWFSAFHNICGEFFRLHNKSSANIDDLVHLLYFREPETAFNMVVDQSHSLHICVGGYRANEFEAAPFELFG